MTGEATGSYFNGGDGSAEKPYEIDNARQLYYFNWLQDLGYFNKHTGKTEDGSEDTSTPLNQVYFKLTSDIDVKDLVLPPAGTKTYPFIGNFDGAEHVISNLTISNKKASLSSKPDGAKFTNDLLDTAEIVGYFGIIGQYAETLNYTVKNTADDGTVTHINDVSNLYFDNLHIDTGATNSLSGLLAWYVNGNMSNCGVRAGYLTFADNAQPISDSVLGSGYEYLSKYSIIGDYNSTNFTWKGQPKSQGGEDFGNSIDIYTVSKRLAFMMHNYEDSKSTNAGKIGAIYGSDTYHILSAISLSDSSHSYNYISSGKMSAGLLSGTYIPLSVSSDSASMQGKEVKIDNPTAEIIDVKNGGYIVGGGSNSYSGATIQLRNNSQTNDKAYASSSNGIQNSLTTASGQTLTVSNENLSFLYYDTSTDTTYRLLDDDNKNTTFAMSAPGTGTASVINKTVTDGMFNNYSNVKTNLVNMLTEATSAAIEEGTFTSGILEPGLQLRKQGSTLETLTATGEIKVAGTTYSSYVFYKGGINFTLNKDGYVSVVIGTYNTSTKPPFYKFYSLERNESNGSNTISNARLINKISGSLANKNLSYKYSDGQDSAYDDNKLAFSFDTISSTTGVLYTYSAYFMEIPLKKGSYFMTSFSSSAAGTADNKGANFPFLLYFDIGQDKTGSGESGGTTETPDIDFVYHANQAEGESATTKTIVKINDPSFIASSIYFNVIPSPTAVYYWRDLSDSGVFYCFLPTTATSAVIPVGSGAKYPSSESTYTSEFETSGS
jgi:hypothetical protein